MNSIKDHPFFGGISPGHVDLLVQGAKLAEYDSDAILLREGEPANQFFLIESGLVAIETGSAVIQVVGPGEALGWSWLFPPFTWHFTARALHRSSAYTLDAGSLLVLCEENHALGYELIRQVTQIAISHMEIAIKKLVL
jgi:CRP-like cAMP-binding protein